MINLLIVLSASSYGTRNADGNPVIKIKHNFFQKHFLPILSFGTLKVLVFSKTIFSNLLDPPQEVFLTVTTTKKLD